MRILGDRVLLEQLPRETRTLSGLAIPAQYQAEQQIHRVLQLGEKCASDLSVGDVVLVDQYSIGNRTGVGPNRWIINTSDIALAVGA